VSPRRLVVFAAVALFVPLGRSAAEVPAEAAKARAVLQKHCYRCHGEKGTAEGGMNFVLDRDKLVAKGVVVPNKPDKSPLLKRTADGEMPADDVSKPTDAEVNELRAWIAGGAAPFTDAAPKRAAVGRDEMTALIAADLRAAGQVNRRRFVRYFTLTHVANAGRPEEELQTYRNALVKLVNSLSWGRRVVPLAAVDPAHTVFRFDLRDLQWTDAVWNAVAAAHPYNLEPETPAEKAITAATGTRVGFVRGDWFVAAASRPPLYHLVLQLPEVVEPLEARLGVDASRNIANGTVARAGFNGSGVSHNNRLIERHESSFGAYWKSYDFASNAGKQNLFDRPLGPGADDRRFDHDGGELIFTLPNGLQGYLLVDGRGRRIDKGPTAIVSDPARPDRAVENGLSCMGCHSQGMIRKTDQIRPHVLKNATAFTPAERRRILDLYPGGEVVNRLVDQDRERFRKAVELLGVPLTKTDPIITTAKRFEDELDLAAAVAEAETDDPRFRDALKANPELARALGGLLVKGGTVKRDTFAQAYPDLQKALRRTFYSPRFGVPPVTKRACGIDDQALLFSADALGQAQQTIDGWKAARNQDLAVFTLSNMPDDQFAAYERADRKQRLDLVSKLAAARRREVNPTGVSLLVVRELGSYTWSIGGSNLKPPLREKDTERLMEAVRSHFEKEDFDAGLRAFVATAKEVLTELTPPPAPKK
jgi:mono/diheme cytochrome c family protein